MSDEREKKLPKWAQTEMEKLRAQAAEWEELARGHDSHNTDTRVCMFTHDNRGLPNGSTIEFGIKGDIHRRTIRAQWVDGAIVIRGDTAITISPEAANSVRIR